MTRHQRLEKELKELNDQIELAVTQISHLSQVLSDEAFGMVAVDKAILDEIRGEIANKRLFLEELRTTSWLVSEEYQHLTRGERAGKKFGF